MQIIVSRKRLVEALKSVMPAVATRATLPILAGVRIDATGRGLRLEATDLELTVRRSIRDGITIEEPGCAIASAKPLLKALSAMTADEVAIHAEAGTVSLRAGARALTFDAQPCEDWPRIPDESDVEVLVSVAARPFADAVARACLCASRDEARPVLTSVALFLGEGSESLDVVATDSYRLGHVRVPVAGTAREARTLLVPARGAQGLAKQLRKARGEVAIGLLAREDAGATPGVATFGFGSCLWLVRLIEGEFPNWRQILPEEGTGARAELDVTELTSALKAVEAIGVAPGVPVRLSLAESCALSVTNNGTTAVLEQLLGAQFAPDGVGPVDVAFNPGYLADALRFCGGERIPMWIRDGLKPALFGTTDRRYLLMPVRIS